jgi:hypothetical protein
LVAGDDARAFAHLARESSSSAERFAARRVGTGLVAGFSVESVGTVRTRTVAEAAVVASAITAIAGGATWSVGVGRAWAHRITVSRGAARSISISISRRLERLAAGGEGSGDGECTEK